VPRKRRKPRSPRLPHRRPAVPSSDASPSIGVLSERGIPVIVTTGGTIDRKLLTQTVAVLQKPYSEADLIKVLAMVRCKYGQGSSLHS
jgi:hypothetical protein